MGGDLRGGRAGTLQALSLRKRRLRSHGRSRSLKPKFIPPLRLSQGNFLSGSLLQFFGSREDELAPRTFLRGGGGPLAGRSLQRPRRSRGALGRSSALCLPLPGRRTLSKPAPGFLESRGANAAGRRPPLDRRAGGAHLQSPGGAQFAAHRLDADFEKDALRLKEEARRPGRTPLPPRSSPSRSLRWGDFFP